MGRVPQAVVEAKLAALEAGSAAHVFPSGEAAVNAVRELDPDVVWVETPSGDRLDVVDLRSAAEDARRRGVLSVCDNTCTSPWIQRPLEHGFDVVVHSNLRTLTGLPDAAGGAIVSGRGARVLRIRLALDRAFETQASPFDASLTLREMETLASRMERHCGNAMHVAAWLQLHPRIERVIYPGLATHPQHLLAAKQMDRRYGARVHARLKDGRVAGERFLERCRRFVPAGAGGVKSRAEHHEGILRLWVGVEDVEELIADLAQAFA
jgi:cystathionine gamma-lyase